MTVSVETRRGGLVRRAAVLGATVALGVGVFGAGLASAADKSLTWVGTFPLIGDQNVSTVIHTSIPDHATRGDKVSVPFTIDVNAGENSAAGLRLIGAHTISGEVRSSVVLKVSDGQSVAVTVKLPIPQTPVPAEGPLTFTASGSVDLTIPKEVPAGPATSSVAATASTHVVTDTTSLPEFDSSLKADPAGQDLLLGTTQVD